MAAANIECNGLGDCVRAICLDVAASDDAFAAAGLAPGSADRVLMNPPFNAPHNPSPDRARRMARTASLETLEQWLRTAVRLLRPSGTVTLICALIIFNTIQMAIFNRRNEINIMRLLGASTGYIRGPFIVESAIYGILSAVFSVLIVNSRAPSSAELIASTAFRIKFSTTCCS